MNLSIPGFQNGIARSASESEFPQLWKRLAGLWVPSAGRQGMRLWDFSGQGNHGVLSNMAADDWVGGRRGLGIELDGSDDYLNCGDTDRLEGVTGLTVSAWVKPLVLANSKAVGYKTTSTDGWLLGTSFIKGAGDVAWGMLAAGSGYGETTVGNVLIAGLWTHLCGVFDGSAVGNGRLLFYANGQAKALTYVGTAGASTPVNAARLSLGAWDNAGVLTRHLNCILGPVGIWTRVLGLSEIRLLARGYTPLAQRPTVVGFVPVVAFTGTSNVIATPAVTAATGTETFSATTALTAAAAISAATGTETFTGVVALIATAATTASAGVETFSGTSALTAAAATSAATGTVPLTGSAALSATPAIISGTGNVSGGVTPPPPVAPAYSPLSSRPRKPAPPVAVASYDRLQQAQQLSSLSMDNSLPDFPRLERIDPAAVMAYNAEVQLFWDRVRQQYAANMQALIQQVKGQ